MQNAYAKICGIPELQKVQIHPETLQMIEAEQKSVLDFPLSGTIYGTMFNYAGTWEKQKEAFHQPPYQKPPEAPVLYIKPANTFTGPNTNIPIPEEIEHVEIGACLGVVMKENATQLTTENAMSYVLGYTIVNDISIPHENVHRPAIQQKARDRFCAAGPWIMEKDSVPSPDALEIRVYINGELCQHNSTVHLIRSISQLLVDVTEFMTLRKGDTLLVGIPDKPPLAKALDEVRIEIDTIGNLDNSFIKEQAYVKEVQS